MDVGFPPQRFNVWVASNSDFTSSWLLFEDAWEHPSDIGYHRRRYTPSGSTTFVDTHGTFEKAFNSGRNVTDIFSIPGTELSIRANFGLVNGVSLAMLGYLPLVPFDGVVGIVNDAEGGFVRSLGRRLKDKIVSVWTARFKYVEGNYVEDDDATWTLGAAFFSSHCVAYDWEAHTIGFAKAK